LRFTTDPSGRPSTEYSGANYRASGYGFLGGNMKKLINITVEALRYIEQKYHHRVYLCDTCEHNENNRCLVCGCFVTVKAAIPTAKCPKGKW
jgi:hypothetical protein